jgi:outer membrane porin, OprD family
MRSPTLISAMRRAGMLVFLLVAGANAARAQNAAPASAVSTPAPLITIAPSPAPHPSANDKILINGQIRAYEFYRTNEVQNASNPNRQAFDFGGSLHLEYHRGDTPLYIATTYAGTYPFGLNGQQSQNNPFVDNSLPGFALSTFDELYLGYSNSYVQAKVGNQVINTPWANASDSRIKPVAFQGASLAVAAGRGITLLFDDMDRFESRTSSAFGRYTLLTAPVPGAANALLPATAERDTSGFVMGGITYQPVKQFEVALVDYRFDGIANMLYLQAQDNVAPHWPAGVTAGLQFVRESTDAQAVVGKIDNQTVGLQLGTALAKNLTVAAAGDYAPWQHATVPLASCAAATYLTTGFFLPGGGTPSCVPNGNGTATIYYGRIASPYTDSYATDPLYTTSISQGMADRRSATATPIARNRRSRSTSSTTARNSNTISRPRERVTALA